MLEAGEDSSRCAAAGSALLAEDDGLADPGRRLRLAL